MHDERLFLGFDGGQSGSRALLVNADGRIVAVTCGPPFDHVRGAGGPERVRTAFRSCLSGPEIADRQVDSAFFGLTGLWSPESPEAPEVAKILGTVFRAQSITLDNDSVSCWAGALGGGNGVMVAAGTGVVAYGANESGMCVKLGGWGYLMGDTGGAYDIGHRALLAVTQAEDDGQPAVLLKESLLRHFAAEDLRDLQANLQQQPDHRRIASCAGVVGTCACEGDPVSQAILGQAGQILGRLALAAADRLGWNHGDEVTFSMTGGVFKSQFVVQAYRETILEQYSAARIVPPVCEPVVGAVFQAWREAGLELSTARVSTLLQEWRTRHADAGIPGSAALCLAEPDTDVVPCG